jgi:hypothetical protein
VVGRLRCVVSDAARGLARGGLLAIVASLSLAAVAAETVPLLVTSPWVLSPGQERVVRSVVNHSTLELQYDDVTFERDVTNYGTLKITESTVHFEADYRGHGAYISDPSDNYFNDLIVGLTGFLVGGVGDRFFVSGDFISSSAMTTSWYTIDSYLGFRSGVDNNHLFHVTGEERGASETGYSDNFGWGILAVASGNDVELVDGNGTPDGALYVIDIEGVVLSGSDVTNISGSDGINIYYDPDAVANAYLASGTYDFGVSGQLIPVLPMVIAPTLTVPGTVVLAALFVLLRNRAASLRWLDHAAAATMAGR